MDASFPLTLALYLLVVDHLGIYPLWGQTCSLHSCSMRKHFVFPCSFASSDGYLPPPHLLHSPLLQNYLHHFLHQRRRSFSWFPAFSVFLQLLPLLFEFLL